MAGPTKAGEGESGGILRGMRTRRLRSITTIVLVLALAGCGSDVQPGPRALDGVFPAQGDVAQLPVRVSDLTGAIRTVSIVSAMPGMRA